MTDLLDASLIDILNRQEFFWDMQVDHGAIRAPLSSSTHAHAFVPLQVRTSFPVPIDRRSTLFLYQLSGRFSMIPLFHPNPLLTPLRRPIQFFLFFYGRVLSSTSIRLVCSRSSGRSQSSITSFPSFLSRVPLSFTS